MCVIKKLCLCTCVFLQYLREKNYCKSQIQALCAPAASNGEFCWHLILLASNGENLVLRPNKIFLKANFLRYQPQIWNTTCLDLFSSRFRVQHVL